MTPFFEQDGATLYQGHALALLRSLPDACVQTCVTSPPYYSLRDYGHPEQIGLEKTPGEYIANLTEIFREVKRVLRDDGTVWCNLGDSYSGGGGYSPDAPSNRARQERLAAGETRDGSFGVRGDHNYRARRGTGDVCGLPAKNLLGMPWRLAFALQDDGWVLRSDVIWSKPNPMPESVRDRPTKSHEYLFLLAKQSRYFYDADAIREPQASREPDHPSYRAALIEGPGYSQTGARYREREERGNAEGGNKWIPRKFLDPRGRNKRTVWTICPKSFREAHFATFPPALVEPCILAGTSAAGECPHCGAAWERVVDARRIIDPRPMTTGAAKREALGGMARTTPVGRTCGSRETDTLGWRPACRCPAHAPTPQTVLDPFSGAATTGLVALQHGRRYIGLELQESYLEMSARRLSAALPQKKAAA